MPTGVYLHVRQHCHRLLFQHFFCVATPIDGPGKKDFGDVDILVCHHKLGKTLDDRQWVEELANILDAVDYIYTKGNGASANFAIPWPEQFINDTDTEKRYIQVDIRVCETLKHLNWILFKHAHGDLWSIVGSMIRPYGVTVDESGFWLRIEEIESTNKNRAKVFLTDEPAKVLSFLGFPIDDYWERPFDSVNDMFEYSTKSPLAYIPGDQDKADASSGIDAETLSSNDRKRVRMRPVYRQFVESFIPDCQRRGRFKQQQTSRKEVTDRAMTHFGVTTEYTQRRREYIIEQHRDMVYRTLIKDAIGPVEDAGDIRSVNYRSHLIKALKLTILEGSEEFGCKFDQSNVIDGMVDAAKVEEFIQRHREAIGRAAIEKQHIQYLASEKRKQGISDAKE